MASGTYGPSYDSLAERHTHRVKISYEAGSKPDGVVPSSNSAVDASQGRNASKDRSRSRSRTMDSASNRTATTKAAWQAFSRDLQDNYNIDNEATTKASTHHTSDHTLSMHHKFPIRTKAGAGEQVMPALNHQPTDDQSGYEGGSESKERKAQKKMPLRPRRKGQRGVKKQADHRKERFDPKRYENIPSDESSSSDDY